MPRPAVAGTNARLRLEPKHGGCEPARPAGAAPTSRRAGSSAPVARAAVADALRAELATLRGEGRAFAAVTVFAAAASRLARAARPGLRRVINAAGVVLHTNLGRALLPAAMAAEGGGYCNLEIELEGGARGDRHAACGALLAELTTAEAALVANNGAAAMLLAISAPADGGKPWFPAATWWKSAASRRAICQRSTACRHAGLRTDARRRGGCGSGELSSCHIGRTTRRCRGGPDCAAPRRPSERRYAVGRAALGGAVQAMDYCARACPHDAAAIHHPSPFRSIQHRQQDEIRPSGGEGGGLLRGVGLTAIRPSKRCCRSAPMSVSR